MRKNRGPASLKMWPAVLGISMVIVTSVVAVGCSNPDAKESSEVVIETPGMDINTDNEDNSKDNAAAGTTESANTETADTDTEKDAENQSTGTAADQNTQSSSASGQTTTGQTTDNTASDITIEKVEGAEGFAKGAILPQGGGLPAYEYPGPEQFYYVVYDYITNELGKGYLPGDVTIPCPLIVYEDDSDNSEILLYGVFQVYNYTLNTNGTTLMTVSGGSHPGLMHVAKTDSGYVVTDFDAVADGSDYDTTAKRIFGNRYDDFIKVSSDQESAEATRAQIIANYAAANDLPITGYQDYGWEKRALPTENIDTFYSDLN
ncbi:hypothetical protein [Butyrivibrio sp. FCS014]|uniref:hypothetical protein n=1 Tax=Butyrivibrio sp. FCS014 TaxID=1408304 RepID=UPI000467A847|nr:hypothetical protein [Butyrivibrio sp. FCS014]